MISRSAIDVRRARLAAQLAEAQQQYAQLETILHTLDRQLCAMHGGLQELDALLAEHDRAALLDRLLVASDA